MKKAIKIITDNFGLKVLAVVFAVIFWMVVVNIDDPDTSKQFTVPVTIINETTITEMGKVYEILDDSNTAVFTVTAKRSIVDKLSSSDFKATADMKEIEGMSLVPIEITPQRYAGQLTITKKNQNVQVSVEDMQTSQFVITSATTGTPASGCGIGSVVVTPNVITISGAQSVVSKIAKVVATVNVDGMSTDITDSVIPVLYDADGKVIASDNLTYSQQTVAITALIQNTKSVPVSYEVSGTPAAGYQYIGAVCAPETVNIQGDAEALNAVSEITIPAEVLDITNATSSKTETIDLTPYLPEGIVLVDADSARVAITVTIEQLETRTYSVPVKNITTKNLQDGLELAFDDDSIDVQVTGLADQLDSLDEEKMTGTIDASGLSAGAHNCDISMTVDAAIGELVGQPTAAVTITEKNSTNSTNQSSGNNTTGTTGSTTNGTSGSTSGNATGGTSNSTTDSSDQEKKQDSTTAGSSDTAADDE